MRWLLPMLLVGGMALAPVSLASSPSAAPSAAHPSTRPAGTVDNLPQPPLPAGESTNLGGAIRKIDPVLDEFTLDIVGERPMRIQFDERTKVFRDGVRIPLGKLGPTQHASVQTALDGTHVFAESIHILSQMPRGECEGVVRYIAPGTGKLSVDSGLSPKPVSFFVPGNTPTVRVGQPEFTAARAGQADLKSGALISISFTPSLKGQAVVRHITVMAVPGSSFLFGGNVTYLDLASGSLVLADPRDGKSYRISFEPSRFPSVAKLHIGANVTVTANYQGSRYVASRITVN